MDKTSHRVEDIVSRFCASFPSQVESLLSTIDADDESPDDLMSFLYSETHRMSGAAKCMGFLNLARDLDDLNKQIDPLKDASMKDVEKALPDLKTDLERVKWIGSTLTLGKSKLLNRASALDEMNLAEGNTADAEAKSEAMNRMLSRETILFADDDPFVRQLIDTTFRELGFGNVVVAGSGKEVLIAIESAKPTFIITDWEMHPVSGLELLKRIRSGHADLPDDTPVIIFTSFKDKQHAHEATKAGANKVRTKPMLPADLVTAVIDVIGKRYQIRNRLKHETSARMRRLA